MDQNANQPVSTPVPTAQTPPSPTLPVPNQSVSTPPKQNYFARLFTGRVNRRNFIIGLILPTVILIASNILLILISGSLPGRVTNLQITNGQAPQQPSPFSGIISMVLILLTIACILYIIIYTFSLTVRRLHDLNKTGWLCLLHFVPFVNILFDIYILFFPGTIGENQYGAQPLPRLNIKQDILRFS